MGQEFSEGQVIFYIQSIIIAGFILIMRVKYEYLLAVVGLWSFVLV